jgi:hypothetical protein
VVCRPLAIIRIGKQVSLAADMIADNHFYFFQLLSFLREEASIFLAYGTNTT